MRMCGHAHHDDMLYLGRDTPPSWDYPRPADGGYADRDAYGYWSSHDPIRRYADRLAAEEVIAGDELERWKSEVEALVEREAQAVVAAAWPDPSSAGAGVVAGFPVVDDRQHARRNRQPDRPLSVALCSRSSLHFRVHFPRLPRRQRSRSSSHFRVHFPRRQRDTVPRLRNRPPRQAPSRGTSRGRRRSAHEG